MSIPRKDHLKLCFDIILACVYFITSARVAIRIQCVSSLTITSVRTIQILTQLHTVVDAQETLINF